MSATSSEGKGAGDTSARAERRGARAALAVFVVLATLFIVSSTWQLTRAVFFDGHRDSALGLSLDPRGSCAGQLRGLTSAVERGLKASASAGGAAGAAEAFQVAINPEWSEAASAAAADTCAKEPGGEDAFAATLRLRWAAEAVSRSRASDLAKARDDVAAWLTP